MWKRFEQVWVAKVQRAELLSKEEREKLTLEILRFISGHYMLVLALAMLVNAIIEERSPVNSAAWTVLGLVNTLLHSNKRFWRAGYFGLLLGWAVFAWSLALTLNPSHEFSVAMLRTAPLAVGLVIWIAWSHSYLMRQEVKRTLAKAESDDMLIADRLSPQAAKELLARLNESGGFVLELEVMHRAGPGDEIRGFISDTFEPIAEVYPICMEVIEEELALSKPDDLRFCIVYKEPQVVLAPA